MSASSNSKIVLYIEDEENDRFLLNFAFKRASPRVMLITAKDGEEAIQWLSAHAAEAANGQSELTCVLLDLNLPRKNGFEVLAWLRQQPAYKTLPVIILSSSDHPNDRDRAMQLGANRFEVKTGHYTDYERLALSLEECSR